jgi:hypothetical protein
MSEDTRDRRDYFRYNPDDNALAEIRVDEDHSVIGLLRDESYSGCAAVFQQSAFRHEEDEVVSLRAGKQGPRPAEVQWTEPLDDKLVKVGFEWVE